MDEKREDVERVEREFEEIGVNSFVEMRGDKEKGIGEKYVKKKGGYKKGEEMVGGMRNIEDLDI